MKQTFSILFLVKSSKVLKSGEAPIFMRLTLSGARVESQLKRRILPQNWDQKKERAIGKDAISIEINRYLESIRARIYSIQRNIEDEDIPMTLEEIKDRFDGCKSKANQCKMLFEVYQEEIERMESLMDIDYAKITIGRYKLCLSYFKEMYAIHSPKADLPLKYFNYTHIRQFEAFLKIEKRLSQNTVVRYMKCFKKIINLAIANGWITKNPFYGIKFKEVKVIKDTLTLKEVMQIYNKELTIPRLERTRDVFVFQCFSGLAFTDVSQLERKHIIEDESGNLWINKVRVKTGVISEVPLSEIPVNILNKYKYDKECLKSGKLLPVDLNQKMNSYLKEIADVCGINKKLSTHVGRHSFASILVANNASLTNVAKMLGHTSTRMTERYARAQKDSILNDVGRVLKIPEEIPIV